jgi:hypothetical protein
MLLHNTVITNLKQIARPTCGISGIADLIYFTISLDKVMEQGQAHKRVRTLSMFEFMLLLIPKLSYSASTSIRNN